MSDSGNTTTVLHNRLAVFRSERGLSRRALADLLGVNPQTVGFLERGQYGPSLELGLRIAALFEVPVGTIFSLTPFAPLATVLAGSDQETRP